MKFISEQCKVCPFRKKSAPGWLGSYNAGDVFRAIWKGLPFFCHSKINYKNKNWEEQAMKNGKLCTGGLVFAKRIMAPDREIQHDQIRSARKAALVYEDQIECMTAQEFSEHHKR